MADAGTLATTAQVLLSIGANASATQVLEANTNYWILYAEAEIETELGGNVGVVANYASITAAMKQYLAIVAANRAAFHAVNQNQNQWGLETTQSKLNVLDSTWTAFIGRLKEHKADFIADLGL